MSKPSRGAPPWNPRHARANFASTPTSGKPAGTFGRLSHGRIAHHGTPLRIEEFPTANGPADYALFVDGRSRAGRPKRRMFARSTAGNEAELVVLATGLGKTWLAAFDSDREEFPRVLFVAHREEILTQAMQTFRRIRPLARLGRYTGQEKSLDAHVLFASIETLGRAQHLDRFSPHAFDYIVVDEFHHGAARTYRQLIEHFTPRFLLGLTATPERMDGGDLLALCQENLVYRQDVVAGIESGLLCPFRYFGVSDDVDYSNIPWRSTRFDEDELTKAVATSKRAQNALEQFRIRGGKTSRHYSVWSSIPARGIRALWSSITLCSCSSRSRRVD